MGGFAVGRHVRKKAENYELRETQSSYVVLFENEKSDIECGNLWLWKLYNDISDS